MKQIVKLIFFFVLFSINSFAQEDKDFIKHKVVLGENVTVIAKKYKVTIYDIYKLNPESKNGINENDILLIKAVSKGDLNSSKENLKSKIIGESYIVKAKETKFGLAKKFGISIDELEKTNPIIVKDGLKEGQVLTIKKGTIESIEIKPEKIEVPKKPIEEVKKEVAKTTIDGDYKQYTIKPKETLYGISKKFNVSQMKIMELNPTLKDGFNEGDVINIPNESIEITQNNYNKSKLIPNKSNEEKTLVLFLPFNIAKMEADSTKTKSDFLRTDETLNIALDFYAGSLMAMDSLKKLGYPIHLKVFDTESNVSNAIEKIIKQNDFSKVDAVLGPLYNNQIEQTALLLKEYNIPVISPLSKVTGKPYSNIYYSMPSEEIQREMLFDFFQKNNGNAVAVFSKKRVKTRETLTTQFPDLKVVPLTEKGGVTSESIAALLDPNKMNYIIMDTESTGTILNVTGILSNLKSKYKLQLVVLELYSALDFEEIPIKRYTNLKMLFPSNTRNNTSGYYESFKKKFKAANNINPSKYATRGFDVTLDTVLRMYQENGFESANDLASEQLESKFNYKKIEEGNYNTGIYILQYTNDLTIEEAK